MNKAWRLSFAAGRLSFAAGRLSFAAGRRSFAAGGTSGVRRASPKVAGRGARA